MCLGAEPHLCVLGDVVGKGRVCLSFPSEGVRVVGDQRGPRLCSEEGARKPGLDPLDPPTSLECPRPWATLNNSCSISCLFLNFFRSVSYSYLVSVLKGVAISPCRYSLPVLRKFVYKLSSDLVTWMLCFEQLLQRWGYRMTKVFSDQLFFSPKWCIFREIKQCTTADWIWQIALNPKLVNKIFLNFNTFRSI